MFRGGRHFDTPDAHTLSLTARINPTQRVLISVRRIYIYIYIYVKLQRACNRLKKVTTTGVVYFVFKASRTIKSRGTQTARIFSECPVYELDSL